MEGTYDMPYKILYLCDYWTKSDGVFAEMQIISYIIIILKTYSDQFTISKNVGAESPIIIFWDNL